MSTQHLETEPLEIVCPKDLETEIKCVFSILTEQNANNSKGDTNERETENVGNDQGIS